MSYLPFRDRPYFISIGEYTQGQIFDLATRLEREARQAYHDSECQCPEGSADFAECLYGAMYPSVSAEEIISALLVEGRLAAGALLPSGRASD